MASLTGGWEVLTRADPLSRTVTIAIVKPGPGNVWQQSVVEFSSSVGMVTKVLEPNEEIPTFELPDFIAAALARGLGDHLPPDTAQAAHLKDAIAVRDRLLAIVERP